jgi:hypothetical protein
VTGQRHAVRAWKLAAAALALACACAAPPRYGLLEGEPDAESLQQRVRAGVNESSLLLANRVAATSAEILLASGEPAVRRNALIFWSRVGDEAARTLYHQDPVASAVDLVAFVLQLQQWLGEDGDGAHAFGEHQARMRETIDEFAGRLVDLLESSEVTFLRENGLSQAREWADAYPLEDAHLARVSIAPLMGRLGANQGRSVFGMSDTVESSVSSIETRLEVLSYRMPAQIVTQAVFLIEAYLDQIGADDLVREADMALQAVEGLGQFLARERAAMLADVDRQREESLAEVAALVESLEQHVSAEREELLARTETMRAETLADLERQRLETLERLEALSAGVLEELDRQGQALADRLDATLARSLADPLEELRTGTIELDGPLGRQAAEDVLLGARELVDLLFLRALVVVGLLGACLVVAAALLRRRPA